VNETVPQRQLQKLMEMSEDLFLVATLEGEFLHVNPAWEWTLGYPLDHLKATPFRTLLHPEDVEPTLDVLGALGDGSRVTKFASRWRHQDGHWVWLRWNAVPDADEERIYAVARDVTDFTDQREEMMEYIHALRSGSSLVQAALTHAESLTHQLREQHFQIMELIDNPKRAAA
jgi:PAS domain S-box-containing protein